jgi:hypothetical protein
MAIGIISHQLEVNPREGQTVCHMYKNKVRQAEKLGNTAKFSPRPGLSINRQSLKTLRTSMQIRVRLPCKGSKSSSLPVTSTGFSDIAPPCVFVREALAFA